MIPSLLFQKQDHHHKQNHADSAQGYDNYQTQAVQLIYLIEFVDIRLYFLIRVGTLNCRVLKVSLNRLLPYIITVQALLAVFIHTVDHTVSLLRVSCPHPALYLVVSIQLDRCL
ncbi:hypothetical protein CL3_33710 [butyrate-producing bacterium SM4/1]|nr:hypothetical protein CL3_33710 [butyrate-producing bacterium SM4/1]